GHDHRDGLAGVADDVARKRVLEVVVERPVREHPYRDRAKIGREIGGGEDGLRAGRRDVDRDDPGVREGAADDVRVQHPRPRKVVDERRRSAQERIVLLARGRPPDGAVLHAQEQTGLTATYERGPTGSLRVAMASRFHALIATAAKSSCANSASSKCSDTSS